MSKRMIAVVVFVFGTYLAQPATSKEKDAEAPLIEKKANAVLQRMGNCLAQSLHFSFTADKMMDFVLDTGQKIQLSDTSEIVVSRPNQIKVRSSGDLANEQAWYNKDTLTILDHDNNTYGSVQVPSHIDQMMDYIVEKYGIAIPLADLVLSDPYRAMIEKVRRGHYIGLNHVGKTKCHHLAFRQEGLDWQLWVDAGAQPVPRKLIITYKEIPGHPQFMAFFDQWNLQPAIADDLYRFQAPPGAQKIDLQDILISRTTPRSGPPTDDTRKEE